jgi:GNAT superfamily N-acetyltransferase
VTRTIVELVADVIIRPVRPDDVSEITAMVHELAAHEGMSEHCRLRPEQLSEALFRQRPALFGIVAESEGAVGGFALYFLNFSTWDGVHGVWAEDVYVRPELRGGGVGRALWSHLARFALDHGYSRVECVTLHDNALGMAAHLALGARPMDDWRVLRWDGDALTALAEAPVDRLV